ncbi:BamA/TamA family outer membrane protein, partial [Escherichia coli]|nr:BamA/TamA family outer membrane protein [Escherichia coli]
PACAVGGEASVAIKETAGSRMTSLAGLALAYNTVDRFKDPRTGFLVELKPDVAGLGGDSQYFRVAGEARYYKELTEDIVGFARV